MIFCTGFPIFSFTNYFLTVLFVVSDCNLRCSFCCSFWTDKSKRFEAPFLISFFVGDVDRRFGVSLIKSFNSSYLNLTSVALLVSTD